MKGFSLLQMLAEQPAPKPAEVQVAVAVTKVEETKRPTLTKTSDIIVV